MSYSGKYNEDYNRDNNNQRSNSYQNQESYNEQNPRAYQSYRQNSQNYNYNDNNRSSYNRRSNNKQRNSGYGGRGRGRDQRRNYQRNNSYGNRGRNRNNYERPKQSESDLRSKQRALPVAAFKDKIIQTIIKYPIVLIVGETGSGKTTQIPQYLLECDFVSAQRRIVCTQPRKVAATTVATRVAYEQDYRQNTVGQRVGYQVRLRSEFNENTELIYMTEGILLRKAMGARNSNFQEFSVVIVDEAHERTVNADLLMGFLKQIVKKQKEDNVNPKLRVIIMSATLDTERFLKYFGNPPLIQIPGKLFPIRHHFLSTPTDNYLDMAVKIVISLHTFNNAKKGHILIFMTGMRDIEIVCANINKEKLSNLLVYPLYSSLPPIEQRKAFDEVPQGCRKCIVATNIAETSLTIDGVVYVIDCGLSKQKVYSSAKGVEALIVRAISKASVKQRIGRAGRTCAGIAYHMYTLKGYAQFENETCAEILRSSLVSETLNMFALGIKNPLKFDYIDSPDEMTLARAINTLFMLKAIDSKGKITREGIQMARFPVDPRLAKCILTSRKYNCVYELIAIAAMVECKEKLWRKPRDGRIEEFKKRKEYFDHISGDHLSLLNLYNAYKSTKCTEQSNGNYGYSNDRIMRKFCDEYFLDFRSFIRVEQIIGQLQRILVNIELDDRKLNDSGSGNEENTVVFKLQSYMNKEYYNNIILCIMSGYFMNVAVLGFGGKYWLFRVLKLSESDCAIDVVDKAGPHQSSNFYKNVRRNWVMYDEVMISNQTVLKCITAIKPAWLLKIAPHYFCPKKLKMDMSPIAQCFIQLDAGIIDTEVEHELKVGNNDADEEDDQYEKNLQSSKN